MVSAFLKLLGVVFLVIIIAHAYMFVRYDSVNACEAASNKIMDSVSRQSTIQGKASTALEQGADLARQRLRDGTLGCYRAVFFGAAD